MSRMIKDQFSQMKKEMSFTTRPTGMKGATTILQADPRGLNQAPRPIQGDLGEFREGKVFRFQNTKLPVDYEGLYHDGEFDH